ncbi:MAG: response regulator [Alphaproteobacteria bacterium]|nr:response regulator [Alphaproteobacteria bacterium]
MRPESTPGPITRLIRRLGRFLAPHRQAAAAFEAAGEPMILTDAGLRTVAVNAAARQLVGEGDEPLAPRLRRRLADGERVLADLTEAAVDGRTLRVEAERDPTSGGGWIEISVRPFGGRAGWAVWRIAEATRQKRLADDLEIEQARGVELAATLASVEQRFRRFFEELPVGWAIVDAVGRIEDCNPAFQALAAPGAPAEGPGLRGRAFARLLQGEDAARASARLAEAWGGGVAKAPDEVRLAGPGDRVASLYVGRIDGPGGTPVSLVLHLLDVTGLRSLERQFVQSQKMQAIGQLAGGVAHDFNNLLTAIIGYCDLLLQRHRLGDPSFPDIMQIRQNANRAANLVRQLLAFSRQQTLRPRVLDLTDVIAELSHLLARLMGERITVDVVHGRDLKAVKVDQGQFEQVVINLAVNARDAMPDGGTLSIRTAHFTLAAPKVHGAETVPAGEWVTVEVRDTGSGVPPEHLARVFEPFFTTKPIGAGTGLGLSTVYGIVRQTGGYVFVESEVDKGTTFTIWLPAHTGPLETEVVSEAARRAPTDLTGQATILLVEDEDPVRLFSARALRGKGYKVVEMRTGEAAAEFLESEHEAIDLLITDVMMPGIDGPTLIRIARERLPGLKVICISGYTEDALRQRIPSDPSTQFLAKPFGLKQLAEVVKQMLDGPVAVA